MEVENAIHLTDDGWHDLPTGQNLRASFGGSSVVVLPCCPSNLGDKPERSLIKI